MTKSTHYRFKFSDRRIEFIIPSPHKEEDHGWSSFILGKCSNCSLQKDLSCPAAHDLYQVMIPFFKTDSIEKCAIEIYSNDGLFSKKTDIQRIIRSQCLK